MLADMTFGGSELAFTGLRGSELAGLIVAVSFAAGLNVYATVATLGRWPTPACSICRLVSICLPVGG